MGNNGLTTSKDVPAGTKKKLTFEQKERNKKLIENYSVQIDQFNLEILKLEKAIEMKLPEREYVAQIFDIKEKIKQFEEYKKVIKKQNE